MSDAKPYEQGSESWNRFKCDVQAAKSHGQAQAEFTVAACERVIATIEAAWEKCDSESRWAKHYLDRALKAEAELARPKAEATLFHEVMTCLRQMKLAHGTCQPRSRKACTHCNAADRLREIEAAYRGGRVELQGATPAPANDAGKEKE